MIGAPATDFIDFYIAFSPCDSQRRAVLGWARLRPADVEG
jgi:hypothetical protein